MTRQSEKIRYASWNFIQDIIGFIFNYFLSFYDPGQDHIAETYVDQIQPDEPQLYLCKMELRNGSKDCQLSSISNFHQFLKVFLNKWEIKRNIFLILEEYDHLKRQPVETVQHFSARFNQVYHCNIPDIKSMQNKNKMLEMVE
jgi:hypothetical protein